MKTVNQVLKPLRIIGMYPRGYFLTRKENVVLLSKKIFWRDSKDNDEMDRRGPSGSQAQCEI